MRVLPSRGIAPVRRIQFRRNEFDASAHDVTVAGAAVLRLDGSGPEPRREIAAAHCRSRPRSAPAVDVQLPRTMHTDIGLVDVQRLVVQSPSLHADSAGDRGPCTRRGTDPGVRTAGTEALCIEQQRFRQPVDAIAEVNRDIPSGGRRGAECLVSAPQGAERRFARARRAVVAVERYPELHRSSSGGIQGHSGSLYECRADAARFTLLELGSLRSVRSLRIDCKRFLSNSASLSCTHETMIKAELPPMRFERRWPRSRRRSVRFRSHSVC